ncbi:hypothetical protein CHS0354_013297 [Potamilus streckersoni]|uniref:Uncharacterized protein n=1 Tax=Potamilus streckersoni TaxID=2493646 RepID=A0AAE0W586_9BIVA|nr:hypothetical protein CHS0354_013297 [Potamilus streckersoni]
MVRQRALQADEYLAMAKVNIRKGIHIHMIVNVFSLCINQMDCNTGDVSRGRFPFITMPTTVLCTKCLPDEYRYVNGSYNCQRPNNKLDMFDTNDYSDVTTKVSIPNWYYNAERLQKLLEYIVTSLVIRYDP